MSFAPNSNLLLPVSLGNMQCNIGWGLNNKQRTLIRPGAFQKATSIPGSPPVTIPQPISPRPRVSLSTSKPAPVASAPQRLVQASSSVQGAASSPNINSCADPNVRAIRGPESFRNDGGFHANIRLGAAPASSRRIVISPQPHTVKTVAEDSPRDTVWKRLFANRPQDEPLHTLDRFMRPGAQDGQMAPPEVASPPSAASPTSPSPKATRFFSQGQSLPSEYDLDVTYLTKTKNPAPINGMYVPLTDRSDIRPFGTQNESPKREFPKSDCLDTRPFGTQDDYPKRELPKSDRLDTRPFGTQNDSSTRELPKSDRLDTRPFGTQNDSSTRELPKSDRLDTRPFGTQNDSSTRELPKSDRLDTRPFGTPNDYPTRELPKSDRLDTRPFGTQNDSSKREFPKYPASGSETAGPHGSENAMESDSLTNMIQALKEAKEAHNRVIRARTHTREGDFARETLLAYQDTCDAPTTYIHPVAMEDTHETGLTPSSSQSSSQFQAYSSQFQPEQKKERHSAAPPPVSHSRQQRQSLDSRQKVESRPRNSVEAKHSGDPRGRPMSADTRADSRSKLLRDAKRERPLKELSAEITRQRIREIRSFKRPHEHVQLVIRMFVSLVTNRDASLEIWSYLTKCLGHSTFLEAIAQFDVNRVSPGTCEAVQYHYLQGAFSSESIVDVSPSILPFSCWCEAVAKQLTEQREPTESYSEIEARCEAEFYEPMAATVVVNPMQEDRIDGINYNAVRSQSEKVGTSPQSDMHEYGYHEDNKPEQVPHEPIFDPDFILSPEIERLTEDELADVYFGVEVPGVGKIEFAQAMDLRGWNREEIRKNIQLNVGEVVVYPNPENKPPPGIGLNRPATITMYQCYPPRSQENMVKTSESRMRYERKIQRMTEDKGARFISYNPTDGEWVFAVDNF